MYKISKFTKIIKNQKNNMLFLINTITGRIFCLKDPKVLECIINNNLTKIKDPKLINKMVLEKIIVEIDQEEDYISELRYYDSLYDPLCNLTILPTEQCNFRCKYCYEKFNQGKMPKEIADGIIRYLSINARKFSGFNISWFGGEPLLAYDIIEYLSENFIKISTFFHLPYYSSMTTNGYLLDYETFLKLLDLKISSFQITIDGTEKIHNQTRYTKNYDSTYKKIIDNLLKIKNNTKNRHFTISIRCNLTKQSIEYLDDFIKEMNMYFSGDKRFEFYFRPVGNWNGDNFQKDKILNSDKIILDKLLSNKIKLNYSSYIGLLFHQQCTTSNRNQYVIRSNGNLSKCTVYLDESEVGEIDKNGRIKVDLQKVGKWILPVNINACKECSFYCRCHGYSCHAKKITSKTVNKNCGYEINSMEKIIELIRQSDEFNNTSNILYLDR